MPNNTPCSPAGTPVMWSREEISVAEAYSERLSSASALSDNTLISSTPRVSANCLAAASSSSTPDTRYKIENASPETARYAALRMYETLKRHELRREARKALLRENTEQGEGSEERRCEELIGMEYLMKDGFADYLRKTARILPPIPQQIIRFSGIKYSKKLEIPSNDYETFGSKLTGCIFGPLQKLFKKMDSKWLDILKGVDGYLMPGSMTLVLGPPGSGKSALLEILASRVDANRNTILQGLVMYNNKHASEVRCSRMIAYINGQINKHIPFLTVRETLEFARECTQGLRPENLTPQMRKFFAHALVEGQDPFVEHILEILSLKKIENQPAGEALSDIDRQKLTTAELAMGTYSVMIYDQPLSGCDLAATYDLVNTVKTISRIQQSSAVMSLTQLSEEVFDLFDRIIILANGQIVFQGPRQDAVSYFSNLGYKKTSNLESAEFLEDIAAGNGYRYMAPGAVLLSIDELVEHYRNSNHYRDIIRIVMQDCAKHTYWIESGRGLGLSLRELPKDHISIDGKQRKRTELIITKISTEVAEFGGTRNTSRVQIGDRATAVTLKNEQTRYLAVGTHETQYQHCSHVHSILKRTECPMRIQIERYKAKEQENQLQWEQFQQPYIQRWEKSTRTLIWRQMKITKRLHVILKLRLFQAIVIGIFSGTLFHKLGDKYDQQKMNSVRALGFVSTMSIMLINLVQLPLYMLQRPVFYKHKAQRFFRASSYVLAHCAVNIPQTFIEALVYNLSMYLLAGLSQAGHGAAFCEFLILLFLVAYFGSSVFFLISAVSSILEAGNALAGLLVSVFLLFSGFVIYPTNIPAYFKWLVYINPIHWANISFCHIQFENYTDPCSKYVGQLPFCDQFPEMRVGEAYLQFYELSRDAMRPWLPYVMILGWIVVANILALLALNKLEITGASHSLPHLRKNPKQSNFIADIENEFQSVSSYNEYHENSSNSRESRSGNFDLTTREMKGNGGFDKWVDEFRSDIEKTKLQLQVEPAVLVFENLSFTRYDMESRENVTIFKDISGYTKPQDMLALLGGSQASKSILLKYMAGRIPSSPNLTGNVQINATKPDTSLFRLIGFVETLDAHQPYLTVLETLQFSAALRLSKDLDRRSRQLCVEMVLNELGLLPHSSQLVGSLRDATGRTYEIAKKLTIGVELAANPSILFLEEPIFGLDTTGSLNILTILARLSASGRTIIASLAYPNMISLSFFNQALILTREGQEAFFGPVGVDCSDLINYFSALPKSPKYLLPESPISFVMGILGQGIKDKKTPPVNFAEIYKTSPLYELNIDEINFIKRFSTKKELHKSPTYPASYSHQVNLVTLRTQKFLWRNVQYTYGRLIACVLMGLLMGSLYFQIEYKDTYGVTSRSLYIYMQVMLIGVVSANNVIPQIGSDRLVYFREKRAKMYLPVLYPLSWAIGEIPYFLIATLALVGIGNGMARIATGSATEFLKYWLVLFLFTLCVTYFGMMVTFLAPLPTFAAFIVSIVTSLWVSASGVVVVLSDIRFYRWMYWSNPFQFAINALTSISFYCETEQCGSACKCPRLPDGSYVWDRLVQVRSLSHSRIDIDIMILSSMSLLFVCLSLLFFVLLRHNQKPH